MNETLKTALNGILSYLSEGEAWHRRMSNQCRRLSIRGWGRWHEAESCGDSKARTCLEKILQDNCRFIPSIDMGPTVAAENSSLSSFSDFKNHHKVWEEREEKLIQLLNTGINEARSVNIELYEKLCCLQKEVQNECMRVCWAYDRLELAGWNGHDLGICSMIIHKYFEEDYKDGEPIDFNLG